MLLLVMYGGYLRGVSNGSAIVVDVVVPYDDDVEDDCEIGATPVAVCVRGALTIPPLPAEYNNSVCVVPVVDAIMPPSCSCCIWLGMNVDGKVVVGGGGINKPYGRDCCRL